MQYQVLFALTNHQWLYWNIKKPKNDSFKWKFSFFLCPFFSFSSFFLSVCSAPVASREWFRHEKKMRCHASWKYVVIIHMDGDGVRESASQQTKKSTNYLELFVVIAAPIIINAHGFFFLLLTSVDFVPLEMGKKNVKKLNEEIPINFQCA